MWRKRRDEESASGGRWQRFLKHAAIMPTAAAAFCRHAALDAAAGRIDVIP